MDNPQVQTPRQHATRGKGPLPAVESPKASEVRRTVTRSKAVEAEVETPTKQHEMRSKSPRGRPVETPKPTETKSPDVKASTHGRAKGKKAADGEEEAGEGDQEQKQDLENLLVKAKALTKELEDKLASQSPQPSKVSIQQTKVTTPQGAVKRKIEPEIEASESPAQTTNSKPNVATKTRNKRGAQVTCLDCKQVCKDYIELGRHKRTDCPVVISQHLSPDGNFTEKVDMFQEGKQAKQQKLDVVECYYCTLCNAKFKLRSQVYEHMRFEHANRGLGHYLNYHCPYCPRVFQTTKQRHEHKLERHNDIRLAPDDDFTIKETAVCGLCFQVVPKWDKDKHDASECKKYVVEKESDTFCQLCGVLCQTQEQLKHHRQVEHLNAIHFRCGQCTRTFGHAVELRCHKVSHHTKNPRWEQNLSAIKAQEARKGSPGPKKVCIHISPSVEEVKNPGAKPRASSPMKINLPTEVQKPVESNGGQQVTCGATAAKADSTTPKTNTAPKPTAIRIPAGGGPLSLTPEQMRNLSKGQPIKLVVPKDADMNNLSFTVPGEDGKPKKFSVTPKVGEGRKVSTSSKEDPARLGPAVTESDGADAPQREELAAALGLLPKGSELSQTPTKHRPKRLRSGRTIDNTSEPATPKKDAEKVDKPNSLPGGKPATRTQKVKEDDGKETAEASPQKTRTSARIEAKEDKQTNEKNNTVEAKKTRTSARKDQEAAEKKGTEVAEARTNPRSAARKTNKEPSKEEEKTAPAQTDSAQTTLAPVQVLKPVGKDSVQCMRCNTVLHSMMEVAGHHCTQ